MGLMIPQIPTASAHPYHLQVANETLAFPAASDSVDSTNWVAQSFTTSTGFLVSRVSLFVMDIGTTGDVLQVSVRADVGGVPSASVLTQGAGNGSTAWGWVDFDMNPYVPLGATTSYWIVVRSTAAGGNGYSYWHSGTDLAYGGGTGLHSSDGLSWLTALHDFPFRVYGFVQPSWSFSASGSTPTLTAGQAVVFRANFTNGGPGDAAALWVNLTLPSELVYVSDDAATVGGIRTGTSFAFTNIVPGAFSFNVTAAAKGGTPDGTVAIADIAFNGTDHNGVLLASAMRSVSVTIRSPRLSLSLVANASAVDPGDLIVLNATATNVGGAPAVTLQLEGTVDPNATFMSSPTGTYTPATRTVTRGIPSLGPGAQASLEWTVQVPTGSPDLTGIHSEAKATYRDGNGTLLPQEKASTLGTVRIPIFAPVLVLDRISAEKGDEVVATLFYNNTGHAAANRTSANWTVDGDFALVSLSPATPFTQGAGWFNVVWRDLPVGTHVLTARLQVVRGMIDGTEMSVVVSWAALDGNGNPLPPATPAGTVFLRAPAPVITLSPSSIRADSEATFSVTLTLRNAGGGAAVGWLNLTLPAGVTYVDDNVSLTVTVTGDRVSWAVPMLGPSSSIAIGARFRTSGPPATNTLRFTFNYTDARGSPVESIVSNTASVETLPPLLTVPVIGGIGIAAVAIVALALFLVLRRRRRGSGQLIIDDAFVVNEAGILLAHRSASFIQYQDQDILVGMFKVVQDFVKDSFSRGMDEEMQGISFGSRRILIEKGRHHFVAVVYRGGETAQLRTRVRAVSQEIDERFGDTLAHWQGVLEQVRGITLLLPQVWGQAS